jgi:hypothetical protein
MKGRKTMMVSYCRNVLLISVVAVFMSSISFAKEVPDVVKRAAKDGMKSFLTVDRLDYLGSHGFFRQEDLDNAVLGEGIEIFTIPAEKLLDDTVPQTLDSLITSTNQWMFLIRVDGKAKTLVTVAFIDGKWIASEFGSPEFAQVLNTFLKEWPAAAGYEYKYVKVFQINATFIEVYKKDDLVGIVPGTTLIELKTGKAPREYDPHNFIGTDEILPALRPAVKHNIEEWKSQTGRNIK